MGSTTTWLLWTIMLSAPGVLATWLAYRARDWGAVVRRLGWALLPWGLWLMGLIRFLVRIVDAVADWGRQVVFDPLTWIGLVMTVVSVLMIGGGAFIRGRLGRGEATDRSAAGAKPSGRSTGTSTGTSTGGRREVASKRSSKPADDGVEGMDDIDAILRRHGIE